MHFTCQCYRLKYNLLRQHVQVMRLACHIHINTIFLLMGFTRTKQNCISIVIPLATHSNGLLFYKIVTFWCKTIYISDRK